MLRKDLVEKYAPAVVRCAPTLNDPKRLNVLVAALDASYNAGTGAFCRSPMAANFRVKNWREGCLRFIGWRDTAKGAALPGLVTRRRKESALCMKGL